MALLVPGVSLLRFTLLKKKNFDENGIFFIQEMYCPLTACLQVTEPNFGNVSRILLFSHRSLVKLPTRTVAQYALGLTICQFYEQCHK